MQTELLQVWQQLSQHLTEVQWLLGSTLLVLVVLLLALGGDLLRLELVRRRRVRERHAERLVAFRARRRRWPEEGEEHEVVELNLQGLDRAV